MYNYIGDSMKKHGYCEYCDLEFDYEIKTIEDTKNVICPNCNKRINPKSKKIVSLTKTENQFSVTEIYFIFILIYYLIPLKFF